MSMNVTTIKKTSSNSLQNNLEVSVYPARVVQVICLGRQANSYQGEEKDPTVRLRITYELDEPMLDADGNPVPEKPHWLSETFPLLSIGADRAKSTKRINALDPGLKKTRGDFGQTIGLPCTVTVGLTANNNFKVADVNGLVRGMSVSELVNPPVVFDFYEPDMEIYEKFPDWIKEELKSALDFKGSALDIALNGNVSKEEKKPSKNKKEVVIEEDDDEIPY